MVQNPALNATLFVAAAMAYVAAVRLIDARFKTNERMTWYRFLDRWGLLFILLPGFLIELAPAHWFSNGEVRANIFKAAYASVGIMTVASVIAAVLRGRELKRQANAAERHS